ncbi:unnamed protein product [Litomosoides sigmodontis]|uniref:Uncharacterized protein n=1 Tax=Litomosoides sigmodontis TaxID=42156 RepID=A0A3P6SNN7_LITSI|nr:unnamed protein product [Litomosoides sigmodontis]
MAISIVIKTERHEMMRLVVLAQLRSKGDGNWTGSQRANISFKLPLSILTSRRHSMFSNIAFQKLLDLSTDSPL